MKVTEGSLLWRLLGRREAFSMVAARCSAAEAAQLKELRDSKAYTEVEADWREFSPKYLHMSHDSANRIIRNLEEFGPAYFDIAQFTRISPETYRTIAPSIDENGLRWNGEAIALIPENAEKVSAAVNEMRKAVPTKSKKKEDLALRPPSDPYLAADWHSQELLGNIEAALEVGTERWRVENLMDDVRKCLDEIQAKM